jgi:hypothetical protein
LRKVQAADVVGVHSLRPNMKLEQGVPVGGGGTLPVEQQPKKNVPTQVLRLAGMPAQLSNASAQPVLVPKSVRSGPVSEAPAPLESRNV